MENNLTKQMQKEEDNRFIDYIDEILERSASNIDIKDIFIEEEYIGPEIQDDGPKIVKNDYGRIIGILDNPDILKYKFD